ncbi:hypothetical protein FD755_014026, partial [Muntiacus reevesi]
NSFCLKHFLKKKNKLKKKTFLITTDVKEIIRNKNLGIYILLEGNKIRILPPTCLQQTQLKAIKLTVASTFNDIFRLLSWQLKCCISIMYKLDLDKTEELEIKLPTSDGITDSVDTSMSKLQELVKDREIRFSSQSKKTMGKLLLQNIISQKKAEDKEGKDEPSKDNQQQALIDQRYFQVLSSINSIIHNPRAPVIIYKQSKGTAQHFNRDLVQDCGFEHLVPIIEMWADQLASLKDLYKSLKILSAELVPWHNLKKQDENEGVRVEDLLFIVDTMLEEVENKAKDSNMPDFHILRAIVSHFQKLFDVPSLTGVYPRMNEVYTRLGELNNAVRNLQELLELDSSSSLCVLVSTVGKLCKLINEDVNEKIMQVLGPEDLQSIIRKLEEHEEFFPAFQAFTNDLLKILGKIFVRGGF